MIQSQSLRCSNPFYQTYSCPTLIVHGTDDRVIPLSHGIGLYDALGDRIKAKPYWAIGRGHNDLDYNFEPMVNSLNEFLDQYLGQYKRRRVSLSNIMAADLVEKVPVQTVVGSQ